MGRLIETNSDSVYKKYLFSILSTGFVISFNLFQSLFSILLVLVLVSILVYSLSITCSTLFSSLCSSPCSTLLGTLLVPFSFRFHHPCTPTPLSDRSDCEFDCKLKSYQKQSTDLRLPMTNRLIFAIVWCSI